METETKHEPHPAVAEVERSHRKGGEFVLEQLVAAHEANTAVPEVELKSKKKKVTHG